MFIWRIPISFLLLILYFPGHVRKVILAPSHMLNVLLPCLSKELYQMSRFSTDIHQFYIFSTCLVSCPTSLLHLIQSRLYLLLPHTLPLQTIKVGSSLPLWIRLDGPPTATHWTWLYPQPLTESSHPPFTGFSRMQVRAHNSASL